MPLAKYHWKRDKPDTRDYIYKPTLVSTPAKVDLRAYCSPIEDQGYIGSCTANAIAAIVEYLGQRVKKYADVSRLFIYYEERVLEGTVFYDSGAYLRDGIKVVNKKGVPNESAWPYIERRIFTKPPQNVYTSALKRRALTYQRCVDFAAVKAAIAAGYPVVVGFDVYESFETGNWWNTTYLMPYPNKSTEAILGGHAVALVGYDDNKNCFIARNSWGARWGDRGYFYMPYQVIQDTSMSDDFWIITSMSNP